MLIDDDFFSQYTMHYTHLRRLPVASIILGAKFYNVRQANLELFRKYFFQIIHRIVSYLCVTMLLLRSSPNSVKDFQLDRVSWEPKNLFLWNSCVQCKFFMLFWQCLIIHFKGTERTVHNVHNSYDFVLHQIQWITLIFHFKDLSTVWNNEENDDACRSFICHTIHFKIELNRRVNLIA